MASALKNDMAFVCGICLSYVCGLRLSLVYVALSVALVTHMDISCDRSCVESVPTMDILFFWNLVGSFYSTWEAV